MDRVMGCCVRVLKIDNSIGYGYVYGAEVFSLSFPSSCRRFVAEIGNRRIAKSQNQKIAKSRNSKIRKSENQRIENRKSLK